MISTPDAHGIVPASSVWAGWEHEQAGAWADALLAFERPRFTSTAKQMLLTALWHDWHERRSLPELRRWEEMARGYEARGVTAHAFERSRRDAGAEPWSPAAERENPGPCPEQDDARMEP